MSRTLSRPAGAAAASAAVLLAVTAIWYALYSSGITVPPVPDAGTPEGQFDAYYRTWFPSVVAQDLAVSLFGAVSFLVLALMGALVARSAGEWTTRFTAGWAIATGGLLGAVAFLVQYGGHGAVADAGRTTTATEIIGFGAYTVELVSNAIRLAGYALIGIGILATGGAGLQRIAGVLAGGALVVLAVTGFADDPLGYGDALRLVVAVILFPAWAATQLLGGREPEVAATRPAGNALGTS